MTRVLRLATVLAAAVLAVTAASAQDKGRNWAAPKCTSVTGTAAVTFTNDEGATLAPTDGSLFGTVYTEGLATLSRANTMLAVANRTLYRSTSGGCRWSAIGDIPTVSDGAPVRLAAAPGDRAYGWSDGRADLVRIDGRKINELRAPSGEIVGIAADPANADHVRLGDGLGIIWESFDAGVSWTQLGVAPVKGPLVIIYRVAFDPNDLDHAVVGSATTGAFVTFDGGLSWTTATGLSSTDGPVNVFNGVISPADPNVVYVMGLDINESDAGAPSQGRHIYRSTDGGASYAPVVDSSADVILPNGPVMAAHPANPDVVYFIYGASFANYGTDLYRYDQATGLVTKTHNAYDRMSSIAFNPADPSYMYLGLANESIF